MYFLRGVFLIFTLKLLLAQAALNISLSDGGIIYKVEWNGFFEGGSTGALYKGERIEGEKSDIVAFKIASDKYSALRLRHEKYMYEFIGEHKSIPKVHTYFPEIDGAGDILVLECLGKDLLNYYYKLKPFSIVTVMRIGLKAMDALEYLHKTKKVIHYDVKMNNFAVGLNDSEIYIFDFNTSEKYEIVGESIVVEEFPGNDMNYKIKSPRHDIKGLAIMLIEFSRGNNLYGNIKHSLFLDLVKSYEKKFTSEEFKEIIGNSESKEALAEFLQLAMDSRFDIPDYEALKNILRTELDKHQNEPNFDKFDWQITEVKFK